jgi:HEAT repeat protein
MAEQSDELKKLAAITSDMEFTADLRIKAIEQLGTIGSHEALLILLEIVANERLTTKERELALERARKIVKSSHQ